LNKIFSEIYTTRKFRANLHLWLLDAMANRCLRSRRVAYYRTTQFVKPCRSACWSVLHRYNSSLPQRVCHDLTQPFNDHIAISEHYV